MINDLRDEIKRQIEKKNNFSIGYRIELIGLLVLKYACDTFGMSYEMVIKADSLEDILFPEKNFEYKSLCNINHFNLLTHIQYEKIEDLVKEYLGSDDIGINIFNNNSKKVCIISNINASIFELYKGVYDINGNTTYVTDKFHSSRYVDCVFKFYDKVLGINNQYMEYDKISFKDYDYLYVYDGNPTYRFIKNSDNVGLYRTFIDLFNSNKNLKIILHTNFRKISNLTDTRFIIDYISKILFYDDKNTFVYYEKKDDETVSIIDYNKDKIKSLDKLFEIIDNNRKQKDVLVKTTGNDIKKNCYRIGFRLYQDGVKENIKSINEIVDENTRLINRLSSINRIIEQEINKFINR